MTKRVVATVIVAVALTGCGDDKDSEQAAPADTPAQSSGGGGGSAPSSVDATMKDFEFVPAQITVAAGGKVTWTDEDSANHNVKFNTDGAPEGIDNLQQDESASVTFAKPGSYAFVCTYHPNMQGTVTVE
jgi:plastocyanin